MGSSPLARGLPEDRLLDAGAARIIPARAGFTPGKQPARTPPTDHPRSRGVYPRSPGSPRTYPGSSPLARGLQRQWPELHEAVGIIPARAGFTTAVARTPRSGRDHPRSRGVYTFSLTNNSYLMGSSPLARGLQARFGGAPVIDGIIPARAGFTRTSTLRLWPLRDHPRSRGVYPSYSAGPGTVPGSSPLARGLQSCSPGGGGEVGIIPARAGFTFRFTSPAASLADHPRSRGVYPARPDLPRSPAGSSPLARGLPFCSQGQSDEGGIIPARAGFTS